MQKLNIAKSSTPPFNLLEKFNRTDGRTSCSSQRNQL